jgi:hypothetical protein
MRGILYSLLTRQEAPIADASLRTTQKCHGTCPPLLLLLPLQISLPLYLSIVIRRTLSLGVDAISKPGLQGALDDETVCTLCRGRYGRMGALHRRLYANKERP